MICSVSLKKTFVDPFFSNERNHFHVLSTRSPPDADQKSTNQTSKHFSYDSENFKSTSLWTLIIKRYLKNNTVARIVLNKRI